MDRSTLLDSMKFVVAFHGSVTPQAKFCIYSVSLECFLKHIYIYAAYI